jgi:hypothetical protein
MDPSVQKDAHTVNSVLFAKHDLVCSQKRIDPGKYDDSIGERRK